MLEDLGFLEHLFEEIKRMSEFQLYKLKPSENEDPPGKKYLEQAKRSLKNIVTELIKTLRDNEVLRLILPAPGACWVVVDNTGHVFYVVSDCEGSWQRSTDLSNYFEQIRTLSDAHKLYETLCKPQIYKVENRFLKLKEEKELSSIL